MSPPQEQDPSVGSLDPLPGRLIAGNFRIEKLIGQGAMGNVYQAEQLSLGKAVAVKVLHPHLMDDEKLVGRFKREAKSASKLNHPNSIQIIDSGQDADGTLYIAMELLAGRDLAQVIRDDFPLSLPRVVRIMTQVMSALDEAHAMGVIHRDLKPSNIMLIERRRGEKDFVKVCDFGIAKATTADGKDQEDDRQQMLTIQGLVCGTPEYMSPEQARAENLDGRSDLYSAAIILYQLVTGDIPYKADSPMGIVSRHLAEIPTRPSARRPDLPIPKAMDDLILRGMEKSRDARFASAVEFRAALEAVVSTTPGQFTPFPPGIAQSLASTPTTPSTPASPSGSVPGATAMIPPLGSADKFGTTADLTSSRRGGGRGLKAGGLIAALLAGAAAAAYVANRPSKLLEPPKLAPPAVAVAASAAPVAVAPPPAPVAQPPAEAPAAREEAAEPEAPAHVAAASHARRHHPAGHAAPSTSPSAEPPPSTAVRVPSPSASVTSPPVEATPPTRGAREVLAEGEKLLSQGEVGDACARGEEAKHMSPKQPSIYKFLGKCYMREGRAPQANENYSKYLELSPNAPDAPFIKSMTK
jgi:serine/threonine protein kinase